MDEIDIVLRDAFPLLARQALFLEPVEHVLAHRLPREQGEMLEHYAPVRSGTRHVPARDLDAPLLQRDEAAEQVEERRLPAAGGAEEGEELARTHVDRDIVEGEHGPAALRPVFVAHALDRDAVRGNRGRGSGPGGGGHPLHHFSRAAASFAMLMSTCFFTSTDPSSTPNLLRSAMFFASRSASTIACGSR